MKKFLSILLALAVGFTFTFGSAMSAFAATHTVTLAELNAGYVAAQGAITAEDAVAYDAVSTTAADTYAKVEGLYKVVDGKYVLTNKLDDANPGETTNTYFKKYSYAIPADAWQTALKKAYEDKVDDIATGTTVSVDVTAATSEYITLAVKNLLLDAVYGEDSVYGGYAAATQFDSAIAKIAAAMEACDTSIYSEKEYTAAEISNLTGFVWTVGTESFTVAKKAADAQLKADVKAFNKNYSGKYADVVKGTATKAYSEVVDTYMTAAKTLIDGEYRLDEDFLKKSKEASLDAADEAAIANGLTVLANDIATFFDSPEYEGYTAKTNPTKAEVDEAVAAYKTAQTWLNNNVTPYSTTTITYNAIKAFPAAVANVEKFNAKAVELKAKKYDDGSAMYDAKVVDKDLETATKKQYQNPATTVTFEPAKITYLTEVEKAVEKKLVAIDEETSEDYASITADFAGTDNDIDASYYLPEFAKVKEAVDAFNTAIDAAKTNKDVTDAEKALKKAVTAIKDKTAIEALYKAGGSLNETFVKERKDLINYYKYFVTLNTDVTYVPVFRDVTATATGNETVATGEKDLAYWYILKNARTIDEVKALATEAKAAVGAAKTTTELKAEAQAVTDMINALPATVTMADKAAVKAAYDAYEKLDTPYQAYVANYATLTNAIKALQIAELTAVEALDKAVPAAAKVTVADKEAANAAYDAIKEYHDTEMYTDPNYSVAKAVAAIKKVQELELAAIKDAVDNLPKAGKITAEDKGTIEALRAAYNAYVTDYVTNYDADKHEPTDATALAALKGYEEKIVAAELELAEVAKFTDADAKAYVQDLAIAARTVKSGKKVKVTINADVQTLLDNGFTVEYKFYKSTKKSSGYKNTVNKTTNTYTNTNPVKGKNYYKVKLVVKNADGDVVATTPLTQCKYGVRTM